jgi:hypothetical protein
MPRKSKVTAVPIEQPIVEQAETEPKTDAEQLTELVKVVDAVPSQQIEVKNEPLVDKKPQAKRAPKAKKEKPVLDPVVEVVSSTINETVAEIEIPDDKLFTENKKVECPDCGKQMSAKTLKYSHAPNCLFKKQVDKEEAQMKTIPAEVIEVEIQKRMSHAKSERLSRRQKQIESLVANAF